MKKISRGVTDYLKLVYDFFLTKNDNIHVDLSGYVVADSIYGSCIVKSVSREMRRI